MRMNFFCTNFLKTPQGSGTSRQDSRDIPDSSLRNPRKTNFRGRARTFRPPPLRVEDPHPTGLVLFFLAWKKPPNYRIAIYCTARGANQLRIARFNCLILDCKFLVAASYSVRNRNFEKLHNSSSIMPPLGLSFCSKLGFWVWILAWEQGFLLRSGFQKHTHPSIYIYIYMPITSFDGPLLGFEKSRSRGTKERLRQEKAKMWKKTKQWNVTKPPHQGCFFFFWAIFCYKTGKIEILTSFWPTDLRLWPSIYIYIYIYCRVKAWSKNSLFLSQILVQLFFVFLFFKKLLLSARRMRCSKKVNKERRQHLPLFESKLGPILLRNILGPSFDSTLDQVLTQHSWHFGAIFPFTRDAETTMFIVLSAKSWISKAHPKNEEHYLLTQLR